MIPLLSPFDRLDWLRKTLKMRRVTAKQLGAVLESDCLDRVTLSQFTCALEVVGVTVCAETHICLFEAVDARSATWVGHEDVIRYVTPFLSG